MQTAALGTLGALAIKTNNLVDGGGGARVTPPAFYKMTRRTTNDGNALSTDFIALDLTVPPMLEAAMGYAGPARWVGFYWQYDDARAHDGRFDLPADWYAWRVFTEHLIVTVALAPYDFGGEVGKGTHLLLLDRGNRQLYAVPSAGALAFLNSQWTPHGEVAAADLPQTTDFVDLANLVTETSSFQPVVLRPRLAAEVSARMQRSAANYAALATWLTKHLPKPDVAVEQILIEQALTALLRRTERQEE